MELEERQKIGKHIWQGELKAPKNLRPPRPLSSSNSVGVGRACGFHEHAVPYPTLWPIVTLVATKVTKSINRACSFYPLCCRKA